MNFFEVRTIDKNFLINLNTVHSVMRDGTTIVVHFGPSESIVLESESEEKAISIMKDLNR